MIAILTWNEDGVKKSKTYRNAAVEFDSAAINAFNGAQLDNTTAEAAITVQDFLPLDARVSNLHVEIPQVNRKLLAIKISPITGFGLKGTTIMCCHATGAAA